MSLCSKHLKAGSPPSDAALLLVSAQNSLLARQRLGDARNRLCIRRGSFDSLFHLWIQRGVANTWSLGVFCEVDVPAATLSAGRTNICRSAALCKYVHQSRVELSNLNPELAPPHLTSCLVIGCPSPRAQNCSDHIKDVLCDIRRSRRIESIMKCVFGAA